MQLTKHTKKRQKQRAINNQTIHYLQLYGSKQYDGHGAIVVFFDKKSKNKMQYKHIALSNKELNVYMVLDCNDRTVITTGYRFKKIHRR